MYEGGGGGGGVADDTFVTLFVKKGYGWLLAVTRRYPFYTKRITNITSFKCTWWLFLIKRLFVEHNETILRGLSVAEVP